MDFSFPHFHDGVIMISLIKWKKKLLVLEIANMLHFFAKYQTFTKSFTFNISVILKIVLG